MDLLTALLGCSLMGDLPLAHAIIQVQTKGNQYYVFNLDERRYVDDAKDRHEAAKFVAEVEAQDQRAAIGVMFVPVEWASFYGHQPDALWDVCTNIKIGTARLAALFDQCKPSTPRRGSVAKRRVCVLRRYAAELGLPREFIGRVLVQLAAQPTLPKPAPASSRPTPAAELSWSDDLAFSESTSGAAPSPAYSGRSGQSFRR